jgi:hypothetical protein
MGQIKGTADPEPLKVANPGGLSMDPVFLAKQLKLSGRLTSSLVLRMWVLTKEGRKSPLIGGRFCFVGHRLCFFRDRRFYRL